MIADYKKTPRPRWAGAMLLLTALACIVLTNAYVAKADFTFGEPTFMDQAINSPNTTNTQGLSLLHDGLKLYFTASRELDDPDARFIWVSERESADAPWGEAVCLGPYHNTPFAFYPAISPDDLELYFIYGPSKPWGLMRSTRASKDESWGSATPFTELGDAWCLDFSPDSLTVYFDSMRSGGYGGSDIWMASRETVDVPWGEPVNLGPNVNGSSDQFEASISNDGLALSFSSTERHYMCVRATTEDDWGPAIDLGLGRKDGCIEISPDGSTLYFESRDRPNSLGLKESFWQMSILPIVDFNDDGNINTDDLLILIGYWGQNEPLCDIGPTPLGDGIVDIKDLEVFMSYWEKENMPEVPEEEL